MRWDTGGVITAARFEHRFLLGTPTFLAPTNSAKLGGGCLLDTVKTLSSGGRRGKRRGQRLSLPSFLGIVKVSRC